MVSLLRATCLTTLLSILPSALADAPRLTSTSPLGVERGKATEVVLRGTGLGDRPRLVAPFGFRLDGVAGSEVNPTRWKIRMVVDAGTAVGVYPIRVVTDEGVSNPLLFAVGQVRHVQETEPNDAIDQAQAIPNPAVVEGECRGNDRDVFVFPGSKGDRVVVDAVCARIGSGVDPTIRLTTEDGRFVASADDCPGLLTDGYLTAVLPEDGAYVLEFSDSRYAATGRAGYRLLVGKVPFAREVLPLSVARGQNVALELRGGTLSAPRLFALRAPSEATTPEYFPRIAARSLGDPHWAASDLDVEFPLPVLLGDATEVVEPADPAEKLPPLVPPVTILGGISKEGERDEFTIAVRPGSRHEIRVEAWGLGSALDGQLRVFGQDGRLLGEADDGKARGGRRGGGGARRQRGPATTDPAVDLTVPAGQGEVKLAVRDLIDRGGPGYTYRLIVQPIETAFQLALGDEPIAIPRGGTALVPVTVQRGGYDGPIALEVRGLRGDGVTVLPAVIPASQNSGLIGLAAAADSPLGVRDVQVVGKGKEGPPFVASGTTVFAQQELTTPGFGMAGTIPSYTRRFVGLNAAVTRPGPIGLKPEAAKLTVSQGAAIDIPVEVVRTAIGKNAFRLEALSPPTGLSVAPTSIGDDAKTIKVKVSAAKDAPLGTAQVGLVAHSAAPSTPKDGARPPAAATLIAVEVVAPARSQ